MLLVKWNNSNNGTGPVSGWIEDLWKYDPFNESNSDSALMQDVLPSVVSKESDDRYTIEIAIPDMNKEKILTLCLMAI